MNKTAALLIGVVFTLVGCGNSNSTSPGPVDVVPSDTDQLMTKLEERMKLIGKSNLSFKEVRYATNNKKFYIIEVINSEKNDKTFMGFNMETFDTSFTAEKFGEWISDTINVDGGYDLSKNFAMLGYDKESNDYIYGVDSNGGYLALEETVSTPKDLEKVGALIDALKEKQYAETLSTEFGLSEERSYEVAKLTSNWNKISKSRSMTKADANLLLNEVIGASYDEVKNAMIDSAQGNEFSYNKLIDTAAEKNETDPEHMREIVEMMLN